MSADYYRQQTQSWLTYYRSMRDFWQCSAESYSTMIDCLDWQMSESRPEDVEWISQDHVTLCCLHAEALEKAKVYAQKADDAALELTRQISAESYVQLMGKLHAFTSTQELEALCNSSRGIGVWTTAKGTSERRTTDAPVCILS